MRMVVRGLTCPLTGTKCAVTLHASKELSDECCLKSDVYM